MQAENYGDKEAWIGALGKAMIKSSVMIEEVDDDAYMWLINPIHYSLFLLIIVTFSLIN